MSIPHRRRGLFGLTIVAVAAAGLMLGAQASQPVGTWATAGAVSGVPWSAPSVSLVDGRTLILGGVDGSGAATANVLIYDPVTNAVSVAGQLVAARVGHTATLLADGRVLVAGGTTNGALSSDLELFDPALGTSVLAGTMAQARSGHAAARLPDGSVLLVGGATAESVATANGEVFDPSNGGTSILPATLAQPRAGASATTLIDGRVLVAGGSNANGDLASAEIFEGWSQTFIPADTQLSAARSGHTAVLLPHNNSVLIAGGNAAGHAVNVVDVFLPAQFPDPYSYGMGRFAAAAPMAAMRSGAVGGSGNADGYAVVAGGGVVDAERYRFATIKTDKDDYPPGQRAVITGSGWQPGEEVTLLFQEDPAVHDDYVLRVTADAAGNIYWDQWAPEEHDLNVRFYLLASDSRSKAQTTFTDGNIGEDAITIGAQSPNPVNPGGAVTFPVTVNIGGNSSACTGTLSAVASGTTPLPVGTTLVFSPDNTVSGGGGTSHTRTLTIQTPSSIGPSTTYGFTVVASQGSNCQNQNPRSEAGTVAVGASVNTAPVAATQSVSTNEDAATTINLSGSDADGNALTFEIVTSPTNGTLGAIGSVSCSGTSPSTCSAPVTYTPSLNFNGADSFTFRVKDATTFSAAATVSITLNAVNDPPSFTGGGNVTVNEDSGPYTSGWATAISAGPANESGQTVTFTVGNDNAAIFSVQPAIAANGTLTFTPAANAYGTATVSVAVQDNGGTANGGSDTAATQTFTVTVAPVNDAPSFTPGADVTVDEDAAAYSQAWATAIGAGPNESGQTVSFVVANNSNAALFSAQPALASDGTLTFTPAANAFGSASVTLYAQDNGGTSNGGIDVSATVTFTITVNSVNDAPSFTKGADVTVLEDSGVSTTANWATAISAGPANESGQTVTFTVGNDNAALFRAQPAVDGNGTLTFTPAPNASGSATVSVSAQDNGGTANGGSDTSATQTFTITVTAVNDAPSFTAGGNVAVNEDAPAHSQTWATAISAGPNEFAQSVSFVVSSNSNPALFSAQPALNNAGVLTFTPAENAFGSASVTVYAQDDGGTANGGVDASTPVTFTITVNPVNDAPVITSMSAAPLVIDENGTVTVSGNFTDPDVGDAHTILINWGDGTTNTVGGTFSFRASHTYLDDNPTNTSSDNYTIAVTVTDNGATTDADDNLSHSANGTIQVNNLAPVVTAVTGPLDPIHLAGSATVITTFTDAGTLDTHTCTVDWDDSTTASGTVTDAGGAGSCTASRVYETAGVYTVRVTITDDDTGSDTEQFQYIVVYDPSAGFVTGGGWINSPAGAYLPDPGIIGKASFGFVSKYAKGAKVPTGETEFQFKAGNMNFHSLSYDWLVVAGAKAQYKGLGRINGALAPNGTPYKFILTATDGQINGGGGQDKMRIKIWYEDGGTVLVYDNVPGAIEDSINESPTQALAGGSIVIHSK